MSDDDDDMAGKSKDTLQRDCTNCKDPVTGKKKIVTGESNGSDVQSDTESVDETKSDTGKVGSRDKHDEKCKNRKCWERPKDVCEKCPYRPLRLNMLFNKKNKGDKPKKRWFSAKHELPESDESGTHSTEPGHVKYKALAPYSPRSPKIRTAPQNRQVEKTATTWSKQEASTNKQKGRNFVTSKRDETQYDWKAEKTSTSVKKEETKTNYKKTESMKGLGLGPLTHFLLQSESKEKGETSKKGKKDKPLKDNT